MMRKRMAALLVVMGLAALLLGAAPLAAAESQSLHIYPGQDLAAIVNGDSATTATTFYVHGQSGGSYTYNVGATLRLNTGDKLIGDTGTFIERGPAFDPQPTVNIVGGAGVSQVIRAQGTVHLEWVKIVGGTGQYSGGAPLANTGDGLAMGMASNTSSLYAVHITGSDGTGISNARGTFDRIELDDTTQDPNFLSFTGAGFKAINEVEVKNSYVHDNQGNGLWCDEFCQDSASHPNGFWIHDNLVVNNGGAGIRFERVGDVSTAGEALIENNEVHGNSSGAVRGGVDIRDAQNALVRNNVFGARTIAGVAYPPNRDPNGKSVAIRATDSARSDRPDLWNVDIIGNQLNGETIVGCELPDTVVECDDATAPKVTSTVPNANATGVAPTANVTATFSEDMDATSINATTFKLSKKGSTTKLAATVSYSAGTRTATLDPTDSLQRGVTYQAVVTTGAKDLVGNPLDQNSTTTGSQQMAWFFTVST
jgi:hypothetical protein